MKNKTVKYSLSEWVETLPADGRYTFTREQAEKATGASFVATQTALRRLRKKGRIVSPWRGFYVFVPPEYRAAGAPPASWFIDDLMRHCGREYYVGLLSAAALHGAGHQQPMVLQVFADMTTPDMHAGRSNIRVYNSRYVGKSSTVLVQTETGYMTVASPETTAFDLVRFPGRAGYWNNIATLLIELAEKLDMELLIEEAERRKLPDSQRLGYVLSSCGEESLAESLALWLERKRTAIIKLQRDKPAGDRQVDARFRLIPNEEIEPDI